MLWFKFILDLMFFELVSILFAIVPDYGNKYMTKENKNLNHNIYMSKSVVIVVPDIFFSYFVSYFFSSF